MHADCTLLHYVLAYRLKLELQEVHTTYTKVWKLHEPPIAVVKTLSSSSRTDESNNDENNDDNSDDVSDDVSDE
jgi:hypothetical protein